MAKKKSSSKKSNGKKNYPKVDRSDFVFPEKREYPINTRQRAKSAFGFAEMHNSKSSETYKKVRRKVKQKYPGLIESDDKKGKNNNKSKKKKK